MAVHKLLIYCRSGNFHVKNTLHQKNFVVLKFSQFKLQNSVEVDLVYCQELGEPGIVGGALWLSWRSIVVDWTFTLGGMDIHAALFVDHHSINGLFAC